MYGAFYHTRLPTDEATKSHCAVAGFYLPSICNETALLFQENRTFDVVKNEKKDSRKELLEEQ